MALRCSIPCEYHPATEILENRPLCIISTLLLFLCASEGALGDTFLVRIELVHSHVNL